MSTSKRQKKGERPKFATKRGEMSIDDVGQSPSTKVCQIFKSIGLFYFGAVQMVKAVLRCGLPRSQSKSSTGFLKFCLGEHFALIELGWGNIRISRL